MEEDTVVDVVSYVGCDYGCIVIAVDRVFWLFMVAKKR